MQAIRQAVEQRCRPIGTKIDVVVNYDAFNIDDEVLDEYSDMVQDMEGRFYRHVSRYTTSAFMRLKLGDRLTDRGHAAHIFETLDEAMANRAA